MSDSDRLEDVNTALPVTRVVNTGAVWGAFSVIAFVDTGILALAVALFYSVAGLTHMGMVSETIFGLVIGLPTLWALIKVAQLAIDSETNPENQV